MQAWQIVRGIHDRWQERTGFSLRVLAEKRGVHYRTICRWQEPNQPPFPSREIIPYYKVTGDPALLTHLANSCEFALVPLPQAIKGDLQMLRELQKMEKEHADALQSMVSALEDGRISKGEVERIRKESLDLIEQIMALLLLFERKGGMGT